MMEPQSILDDLGEEVTGIMAPVSICMAITVALVRILNPDGSSSSSNSVVIASLAYDEQSQDSSGEKLGGALLNALIFVGIMAAMTFVLVLLFKYGCFRIIYAYMAFAVFDIFFLITSLVAIQVLQALDIHIDAFSFCFGMYNFAIVGTVGILFIPMPLLAKQFYMLWTGVITAYIFTWVPEWTSWVLIVVMALYDIAAVLIPGGPLNLLIKVATERQEMLPALVYEARPTRGPYVPNQMTRRAVGQGDVETGEPLPPGSQRGDSPSTHGDSSRRDSARGAYGYQPPDMAEVAPGAALYRLPSPHTAEEGSRGSSPRRQSGANVPGPVLAGGSAQVQPIPQTTGKNGQVSRPGSGGGARRLDGGQEMASASRFATEASEARSSSSQRPSGSAQLRPGSASRGPGPVGEGSESDRGAGEYSALPPLQGAGGSSRQQTADALLQGVRSSSSRSAGAGGDATRQSSGHSLGPLGPHAAVASGPSGGPLTAPAHQALHDPYDPALDPTLRPQQGAGSPGPPHHPGQQPPSNAGDLEIDLPDSIKLGLGDFIFYSMLVGRAAMYDYMTVFASYIGIIAGLGITLVCLAAFQRALPALPFSIALGVIFYFLTRLSLEPFLVPLSTSLTYF